MNFNSGVPIYTQISEFFKRRIASGEMPPGDKVAAVRELALDMGVNPNTMQKALASLEQQNLLYTERTSGRFVTTDAELISKLRLDMLEEEARRFVTAVRELKCSKEEMQAALEKMINTGEENYA
jgi:DNA-binding transcriptional regulator YhcF (GntR family)